jgi:hypothetical protein
LAEVPPRIHFGPDESTIPCRKSYLSDVDEEPFQSVFYKDGRAATLEVEQILGPGAFSFPKDSEIIASLISLIDDPNAIVLDSFAGSGTTGHAVLKANQLDGGNRRFVLVELQQEVAANSTRKRLQSVIEGFEVGGARKRKASLAGLGSGFRYCRLGRTLLDDHGNINGDVPFSDLGRYVYLLETGVPAPTRPRRDCPLLGVHRGRSVYLLYNGVLGDRRPNGGNVLTGAVLAALPPHPEGRGPRVVYGEACRLSDATLRRADVTFRQIPYSLREAE